MIMKIPSTVYVKNEELWHFMKYKLKISDDRYKLFQLKQNNYSKKQKKIQLKHIQSLWHELVKRIDGELIQYKDKCLFCFDKLLSQTPITLNCCSLSIHYNCLKKYITDMVIMDTRITLQQLSCPLCRHPMKHKSATELFKDTQILYNKVEKIAINQLKIDGKLNDIAIRNNSSEFYMNPVGFAMKQYAFFLCYKCKQPYFFGDNNCGDNEEKLNNDIQSRLCQKCEKEKIGTQNDTKNEK